MANHITDMNKLATVNTLANTFQKTYLLCFIEQQMKLNIHV